MPESQTPWQAIFRHHVRPFAEGMGMQDAEAFQNAGNSAPPRHNHFREGSIDVRWAAYQLYENER